jgi:predicted AAA+ superfamily ATPase
MTPQDYRRRVVDNELDELLAAVPALAIEGAKAVGKTRAASRRVATIHALDDPAQLAVARGDPSRLVGSPGPVLIDEWQRLPETWDLVRRAVDAGAAPGQFLLAGSVAPRGLGTHSGAGRIVSLRMRPMAIAERIDADPSVSLAELLSGRRSPLGGSTTLVLEDYTREILGSGYPGFRGLGERAAAAQLGSYLDRVVDRDFEELGQEVRNPVALRRWMTAYAAATATTATFETIRAAATAGSGSAPAKSTVLRYRDALQRLWIVDPVPGWLPTRNRMGRLVQAEKHHLADPALAASLLGVDAEALLAGADVGPRVPRDGTLLGALFESLVTLSVRVYAQAERARVYHLRTKGGEHEVDLIVERPDGRIVALEVKLARTVEEHSVRHLQWLRDAVGDDLLDAAVITTGPEAYRREDGIAVIPAALLGPVAPRSAAPTPSTASPYSYGSRDVQPGYESQGYSSRLEPWSRDPWSDDD